MHRSLQSAQVPQPHQCTSFSQRPERPPPRHKRASGLAIPLLEEAAGGHVEGIVGDTNPCVAVRDAMERFGFDQIIASTLPARVSHWLRRDLPSRVGQLGLPVTVVTATQSARALSTTG